jgi:hypothetical protein
LIIERSLNTNRPSGFYEPLGLFFLCRFLCAPVASLRRTSASFGLFTHGASSFVSRSIGEPFAHDALQRAFRTLAIVASEPNAIVIPEIELRKISVQMPLATVLIYALHAALEDREKALD